LRKLTLTVVCLTVLLGLLSSCTPAKTSTSTTTSATTAAAPVTTTPASPTKPAAPARVTPKLLTVSTLDVGSTAYQYVGFVGESIKDKFGVAMRLSPVSSDVGRLVLARTGQIQFAQLGGAGLLAREGLADFSNRAWGPQPLRLTYQLAGGITGVAVRADSNIQTIRDLKGKRIPFVVGVAAHNTLIEGILAGFAGLTWNDVVKVDFPSFAATVDSLVAGKTDIAIINPTSSQAVVVQSGPGGIRWLPLPFADKAGWKILQDFAPDRLPTRVTTGPTISESKPLEALGGPTAIDAYPSLDPDVAYFNTRAWAESFTLFKDKHVLLNDASLEHALDVVGTIPYAWHPGSIAYFKDVGKWTPQLEAWNNKVLDHEARLLKAWEACLAEVDATKLTEDKLPALWAKYRKEVPPVE